MKHIFITGNASNKTIDGLIIDLFQGHATWKELRRTDKTVEFSVNLRKDFNFNELLSEIVCYGFAIRSDGAYIYYTNTYYSDY